MSLYKPTSTTTPWTIRGAKPRDADYIRRLWDRYFGGVDADGGGVVDAAVGDNEYTWAVVAEAGTDRVGAGVATNYPRDHFLDEIVAHEAAAEVTACDGDVAYMNFGAVEPGYRGRGIGRAMFQARERMLAKEAPADRALALCWQRRDAPTSEPLFRSEGWTEVTVAEGFYDDRSYCPDCGDDCDCPAIIFTKQL
jgi:GNAT superfamily N-acetyltransferase